MPERIDSHHHLWAINDTDYVWMTEAHEVIRRDFLVPDMRAAFAAGGIDGSVVVPARQMIQETQWLLGLADGSPQIRGAVGWVPLMEKAGELYHAWAKTARQLAAALSDDEQAAFWGGNAIRIYGL